MRRPSCSALVYDSSEATNCCSAATRTEVSSLMSLVAPTMRVIRSCLNWASGLLRSSSIWSCSSRRWPSMLSRLPRSSVIASCIGKVASVTFFKVSASRSSLSTFSISSRSWKSSSCLSSRSRSFSMAIFLATRSSSIISSSAPRRACHCTIRFGISGLSASICALFRTHTASNCCFKLFSTWSSISMRRVCSTTSDFCSLST
mmetsp:Transcript_4663/g.11540  ORF Transcript_4663/g.11540 Transcript_4663/m.11540 type:complete len:203 (-) Transcript_4663:284-892(-)